MKGKMVVVRKKKPLPDLMEEAQLRELQFGDCVIQPIQTRRYPCIYWSSTKKCDAPGSVRDVEADLRAKWAKASSEERKKLERPCSSVKEECPLYEYPAPYIPEYDEFFVLDEEKAETIAYALKHNDNLLIYGPPGCGKSSLALQILSLLNWGTTRFSCSEETSRSQIIGQWVVRGDEMVWIDGHVTHAMRNGHILLEEESDFMRPELRGELHTVMEKKGTLVLHGTHPKTGQVFRQLIEKHAQFRWISTANTTGLGDDKFLYHGTQMQNAASRDRYEVMMEMDYPDHDTEIEIVTKKANAALKESGDTRKVEPPIIGSMIRVANLVRQAFAQGTTNFPFTIRRTISWAKYFVAKGPEDGTRLAVMNFCSRADKIVVGNFVETEMNIRVENK